MQSRRLFLHATLHTATASVLALTVGCDGLLTTTSPFKGIDIAGARYPLNLPMVDHTGASRQLADYVGKVLVLFFGFTQCPDVCPTTLAQMAVVLKELGSDAARVQVVFISIDPKRDTPAILKDYIASFDSRFVALTGTPEATAQFAKQFNIYAAEVPGKVAGSYTMDHSAHQLVFDRTGRPRLMIVHNTPMVDLLSDIRFLLRQ